MYNVLAQRTLKYGFKNILKLKKNSTIFKKEKPSIYYFAYGANLSSSRFERFHIPHEALGKAELQGYQLNFSMPCEYIGNGYASIEEIETSKKNSSVWGCLFKTTQMGMLMLDILEWVPFNFYERKKVKVKIKLENNNEEIIDAWIYMAKFPKSDLIPSKGYLNFILNETKQKNFPESYINFILEQKYAEHFEIDPGFRLSSRCRETRANHPDF